ncbi:cellulase N-terminal Ig-like domain-containing protein [Croceicoccus marinus]|uniref:Glycoside hydrolase family 9 protein n=1 Tax=Croceicoccus marinus TaxID=450378 RepID=A0A7G6VW46_9SPHN|nr:cellulase N-terminal Ig-like domain-containing protein [Croceicoccus marinus]QNE05961.1 glycoside hydrolase family 9 protein [Croceicoccus marinus]
MTYRKLLLLAGAPLLLAAGPDEQAELTLDEDKGYLSAHALDVIVFDDIYPDGHQTGVTIIQHGRRVAANGDVRLEPEPGQWSPMPVSAGERTIDPATGTIRQTLSYPDPAKDGRGFNPIFYPVLDLAYTVSVTPSEGGAFRITVDLDKPLPPEWVGRVGFNMELFPGELFGKAWLMDDAAGLFNRQPEGPMVTASGGTVPVPRNIQANGPVQDPNDQALAAPLASGQLLTVAPESALQRISFRNVGSGELQLIDGRSAHNNGWYIVRTPIPAGATKNAVEWIVTPNTVADWSYEPVIQVSQLGYAPAQPKRAVIETAAGSAAAGEAILYRLTAQGREPVLSAVPDRWGDFLRYDYALLDFSAVKAPGLYEIEYGGATSNTFRIDPQVYSRHAWQPTLEYFLPVQMCHMRVNEKYRIWHGLDHLDDALMAPTGLNHIDGYVQGPSTLTRYEPGDMVPGLDRGGWHDAGDYDLRVESQIGTTWMLAKMVEEFDLDYDATTIDQANRLVEIHDPDGINDAVQQIEHGLLSVLGGYRSLGRLYRGIITPSLRAYVMLGDAANHTDNISKRPVDGLGLDTSGNPIAWDDRWVFTEDNPDRELYVAGGLAAAGRVMRAKGSPLGQEAIDAASAIAAQALDRSQNVSNKTFALAELAQSTGDEAYIAQLAAMEGAIIEDIADSGWRLASIEERLPAGFRQRLAAAVAEHQRMVEQSARTDSPYGVPYEPEIWGAGWTIQSLGVRQWFFHKGWPEATSTDGFLSALNFVLGVHPGENRASFVSGVGAQSATVAYGVNRADWSYIPGGVISGTNLVRPDLPELKEWPYFWQQGEYVMGGGATNYMFLALAADALYGGTAAPAD